MDKYEYNLKIDQIRQAVEKRDIKEAVKIADEIDWKKERDTSVLIMASGAYEISKQYEKAKELLLLAYEKSQSGRQLAYRLALISAKTKEFDEAIEFYHDFVEMAPRDTARYVLQYRIAKAKGEPINYLIEILEEYVSIDMEEKWMYELAKLYHMAGEKEKCVDLCDEMSLWFSHGEYVRRALDLKMRYKPLTKRQMENYNKTDEDAIAEFKAKEVARKAEEEAKKADTTGAIEENKDEISKGATIPFTTLKAAEFRGVATEETSEQQEQNQFIEQEQSAEKNEGSVKERITETDNKDVVSETTQNTVPIPGEIDIEDIHVKQFEGDGSDTVDIQAVIAKNIQEIMETEEEKLPVQEEKEELDKLTMTLDPLYKYDSNGQIGLDIPEPEKKDKQITGQLSIEDVLRNLEERGILKADTVNKTVETMGQAAEAVDQAAEEAAVRAENEKKNETVVENFGVKDLADEGEMADVKMALESYADDAANGFVFTDEIDSEAIEKALKDSEEMTLPEAGAKEVADVDNESDDKAVEDLLMFAEDSESEEESIEETPIELATDVPVLDLSFEVPVKKLQPGLTPASDPVPANTESLKALFADLDEATKRDIGIFEEETVVQNTTEDGEKPGEKSISEDEKSVENADENTDTKDTDTVSADESAGAGEEVQTQQKTGEQAEAETEVADKEQVSDEAETADKEQASDEAKAAGEEKVSNEAEASDEETVSDEAEATGEKKVSNETNASDEENVSDETEVTDESATTESEKTPVRRTSRAGEMPIVTFSTNKNLTQTQSLGLEKIIVTDEEMIPFESFKTVNGLEQKIIDTVTTLAAAYDGTGTSKTGNVMILGDDKSGKTTMAIELIKLVNKKRERTGRRIAKVDSSVLNTRGIRSSMKKLIGSDLIVENAQHLRKSVLAEFVSVGQYYTDDMLMVFEGETSALKTMRNEFEEIARMFNHTLVIKEYDVKEWVAYAKKYAATKNYMVDEMGTLALYKTIDDFYGKHQGIDQSDVEGIINRAIKKASGKVGRKLTNLFSGKNDDSGMDILKEVDFK